MANTQEKNGELEKTITNIVQQYETASNLAQAAIDKTNKTERALEYLHILSSFKTLDFQRIRMASNGDENQYICSKLSQLKKNFIKCRQDKLNPSTDPIFIEFVNDFIYSIYQLSFYLVAKRDTFKVLFDGVQNALIELRESNENNLDIAYSKLDSKLGELIEVINKPQVIIN